VRTHHYYFEGIKDPCGDAIATMVGKRPPLKLLPRGTYSTSELHETQGLELQFWICKQLGKRAVPMHWSTGIGIMDAADAIVQEAVNNANIAPKEAKST